MIPTTPVPIIADYSQSDYPIILWGFPQQTTLISGSVSIYSPQSDALS